MRAISLSPSASSERDAKLESDRAERERDQIARARSSAWNDCGLQARHRDPVRDFDALLRSDRGAGYARAVEALRSMPDDGIVALVGERGTGKTQLAAAAIIERIRRETRPAAMSSPMPFVLWCRAWDLMAEIKRSWGGPRGSEESTLKRFEFADLLVIDELHVRSGSEWEDNQLNAIVDARYGSRRATILISNLDARGFAACAGASIVDRIRECGKIIVCDWKSFRGENTESRP